MRMKYWAIVAPLLVFAAEPTSVAEAATPQARNQQVQIFAEEMCCKGCAKKVAGRLYAARGVKTVKVDLKKKTVTVSLPQPNAAMLGKLWQAVEQGEGGPTKLVTTEATYTLTPASATQAKQSVFTIAIDNLHCKGCAKKIAAQLYALKGVTKVSADMQKETLVVKTSPQAKVSPWRIINAVAQANERPLAVSGPHGKLAIEWANPRATKNHQQAQQTNQRGIQR
ncbi:MAG: hypothetical protein GXP26_01225 [Planctomycetes bacterium]|nr:hypothetical protein [Planctomycetota bacterium]